MKRILIAIGALTWGFAAYAQPSVKSVLNSASNTPAGLPNSGVAQGSIVAIYGSNMGPATLLLASGAWQTTLGGSSVSVTVGSQTVSLLLYYTSAGQIGAWLPDDTPAGTGTIKVTYNGATSAAAPVTVIKNGIGIFTWSQNGAGQAILTFNSDYSLVTSSKAANAGDILDIWTTGLGPVSGSEPTSGDMPGIPVKVWVGGVSANVLYRGRAGYVGEDQIVFTVPGGVAGCSVPLAIQIDNFISNTTTVPIASSGRVCTPTNTAIPSGILQQLLGKPEVSVGVVSLSRSTSQSPSFAGLPATTTKSDDGSASFIKIKVTGDQLASLVDTTSIGSCLVTVITAQAANPFAGLTYTSLDAGSSIGVSGPSGSRTLAKSTAGGFTVYSAKLGDTSPGNYLDAGTYTVSGPGGPDVGSFNASIKVPTALNWKNQSSITSVNRASGVTVTWDGGDPTSTVQISGSSILSDMSGNVVGAVFTCQAPVAAGTFTVPPPVLLSLPPSGSVAGFAIPGSLGLSTGAVGVPFTASGLDYAYIGSSVSSTISVPYQ